MFKEGMKVVKTFKGIGGYVEKSDATVHSIEDGVVYLENDGSPGERETGVTYNAKNGREIENFVPGMTSFIKPSV